MAKRRSSKRSKLVGRAAEVDRHDLYELSVQDPETEVAFVAETFRKLRGREALSLREGFCGTAVFSLEWVRTDERRTAIGVDLHKPTMSWGMRKRIRPACKADGVDYAARIELRKANVLEPEPPRTDVAVGYNFSYWCFKTRDQLRAYFEAAKAGLVEDGVLFLDAYGGSEMSMPDHNARQVVDPEGVVNDGEPFTYEWEQLDYDPLTHDMNCAIHFELEDGSRIEEAYTYSWRVWSLPELRELLLEAGFSRVRVWAEQEDEDGDETGVYTSITRLDNRGVWWVYLTAEV